MSLPALRPDALTLFVFGPGKGELVAVHIPPGVWLIVDGCGATEPSYATALLDHYASATSTEQKIAAVVWTHPHGDHAGGLPELLARLEPLDESSMPVLGFLPPTIDDERRDPEDLEAMARAGDVEHAASRFRRLWKRAPASRWEPIEGHVRSVGAATLTILSPSAATRAAGRADPNRLSTALLITWSDHRIVLGSDLTKPGWTEALAFDATLPKHTVFKVAHHGSKNALHTSMARSTLGDAIWVLTPFAPSVPKFGAAEGVERMLRRVSHVRATSLPRAHWAQAGAPQRFARSSLVEHRKLVFDALTPGFPDCFVAVELGGGPPVLHYGPGSVEISRG